MLMTLTLWRFMIEVEEIDEIKEVEEAEVLLSFGKMSDEAPSVQFILMRKGLKTKMFWRYARRI